MVLKKMIKDVFSNLPYSLQRFLVFPYAIIANKERHSIDNCLLEKVEIDESLDNSYAKFKTLMNYAYEHVPYYRNAWKSMGITPQDINSYSDIEKLPIIDKHTVIEHYEEFISDEADLSSLTKHSTGGSSGLNLTLLYDDNTVRARRLGILRWMSFAGINNKAKGVWIGRAPLAVMQNKKIYGEHGEKYFGFFNPVSNRLQLATNNMSPDVLKHYVENIKRFKPDYIQGYASGVATLARYMQMQSITFPLKAVLTSSDNLIKEDREVIKKVFMCEVFDRYGCAEEVVSAIECECHAGYHVEIDRCHVEVIDENGNTVEGKVGNIVATNLVNYEFPLIRYKIGDLGSITYSSCPCGRKLPIISELVGRDSEYLVNKYNVKQWAVSVSQYVSMPAEVLGYQIEQLELNSFIVRFCSNATDMPEQVRDSIRQYVEKCLYIDNPNIEVEQCASIPVAQNGKKKYLISHVQ